MTKAKDFKAQEYRIFGKKPLIRQDYLYVMISHQELNDLIAQLMHIAELDSDKEHREALKGELKYRVRSWLDEQYREAGYEKYTVVDGATVVDVPEVAQKEKAI